MPNGCLLCNYPGVILAGMASRKQGKWAVKVAVIAAAVVIGYDLVKKKAPGLKAKA